MMRRECKSGRLRFEKEVEKSFASGKRTGKLERANDYYRRALGSYTQMVTRPCILLREPEKSFGEQSKCEEVGSDDRNFANKTEFVVEELLKMKNLQLGQNLS